MSQKVFLEATIDALQSIHEVDRDPHGIDALAKRFSQSSGGGSSDKNTHETDSGTAKVTDTHVHFDNSGYKQKFTHAEVGKMDKGGKVRGFGVDKSNPYHDKDTSVYSNGDEEHHLPNSAKK